MLTSEGVLGCQMEEEEITASTQPAKAYEDESVMASGLH